MNKNIKHSHVIGVDLGTTNTVMTHLDDAGKPKVIPNKDGDLKTPSAVYVSKDGKEILVGTAALNMQIVEPGWTLLEFKRDVGTDKVYFKAGGQEITPEWCQMQVLKYLRESAIAYFGDSDAGKKVMITVPAYFTEKERQSVIRSAQDVGMELLGLVNEPTAAGLAFGLIDGRSDKIVAIPDLGGGTFDVSIVNYEGGEAKVLASFGDKHLGGKDVDDTLMQLVCQRFNEEHGISLSAKSHPADWFTIRDEVIRQKQMLSARTDVKICVRVDGKSVTITVTRETLRQAIQPLLDRAEKVVLKALADAKVEPKDVAHVLPMGGSSRLTAFMELLKRIFPADIVRGGQVSPDLGIAEGAAIAAAKRVAAGGETLVTESLQKIPEPAIKHTDVMPHSLGVSVQDPVSKLCSLSVILEKNLSLPCKAVKSYASVDDQQTRFRIAVVQGENGRPLKECLVVGERELELPARKSSEPSLDVSMGYNLSGMVQVLVTDRVTGKTEDITVNFSSHPNHASN